ncbi:hypothetical protein L602_000600001190 [Cupriavidus gilardii J11]|uniref:Uncharacterized protein n=1 Tax=Cupriavidus gilardii J11 TaxID=936133 RepID=A0A562B3T9_9BURK|nr:hypothetical protein L602_000600001190 [Cupriavidus gilardii J11]
MTDQPSPKRKTLGLKSAAGSASGSYQGMDLRKFY